MQKFEMFHNLHVMEVISEHPTWTDENKQARKKKAKQAFAIRDLTFKC